MIENKLLSTAKVLDKLNSQGIRASKQHPRQPFQKIAPQSKRLDVDFIGKPAKLLNHDEMEEWFEGERELWQQNY